MSDYRPFYGIDGECHLLDLEPFSYEDWSLGDPVDEERQSLLDRVAQMAGSLVQSTRQRALSDNITLQVLLDNGLRVIVRSIVTSASGQSNDWAHQKFHAELSILRWLKVNSDVPIPSIISNDNLGMSILSLLPGLDAAHSYPSLSPSAKVSSVTSYAIMSVTGKTFNLDVPQRFGSTKKNASEDGLAVGPFISLTPSHSLDLNGTENLGQFFTLLVEKAIFRSAENNDKTTHSLISQRLSRMLEALHPLIEEVSKQPFMMRFALSHQDPRPNNILLDPESGVLTGIVDWEYHAFLPAIFSAHYPSWILYSGQADPRFRNSRSIIENYWLDTPTECARLRTIYEENVKRLDENYYMCLTHPASVKLRDALGWLIMNNTGLDPDYDGQSAWVEHELSSQ